MPKGIYKRSEEALEKMRKNIALGRQKQIAEKGFTGLKNLPDWMKENLSRLAKLKKGERNPNWKGGAFTEKGRQVYCKDWKEENREKVRMYSRKRRALKMKAEGSHTIEEWEGLKEKFGNKCACCLQQVVKLTQDHIVPLSRGGSQFISNIQPLCLRCNDVKATKIITYSLLRSFPFSTSPP